MSCGSSTLAGRPPSGPRLERHTVTLDDGHRIGLAICGDGVPLVVVHGFAAEGIFYARTLSRLVSMGFRVIAIDTAGHGATQPLGLPTGGGSLDRYSWLLSRALDQLGVRRAVLLGHSMGGRLVTELAAGEPDRAIAVLAINGTVGDEWDQLVKVYRVLPGLLPLLGTMVLVDGATTMPFLRERAQAMKMVRLIGPSAVRMACHPWRMVGPAVSMLRSRGTGWMLDRIGHHGVPFVAIHSDLDLIVPLRAARSAVRRTRGELVVVERAPHAWLIGDPLTLPGIMAELLAGRLGHAVEDARERGDCYDPGAPILDLSPAVAPIDHRIESDAPRYTWRVERPSPAR